MTNLKYLLLILVFVSCKKETGKTELKYSKIDSLKSKTEIEKFVISNDTSLNGFKLTDNKYFEDNKFSDSTYLNIPYFKADFDNNGFQDLFVTGDFYSNTIMYSFAMLSYGKDSVNTIWINSPDWYAFPKLIRKNNKNYIEIERALGKKYTLVFKYGEFINFNDNPSHFNIEKIEFTSFDIRGKWEIIVDNNLNVTFVHENGYYEKIIVEKSKSKLSQIKFKEIESLLNYMNFPRLSDRYFTEGTDRPICEIKIFYNGGMIKKIYDYGRQENYSLQNLYKKIESLKQLVNNNTAGNRR